ncbi:MAG TPA: GAF domain-containing sensor histidine kinase [Terriglobales bacterium]|nr:GAF domain-containing sensor histidine kinase [Terriglobales bacterium]
MSDSFSPEIRRRARAEADSLLVQRLYATLKLVVVILPLYSAFDYYTDQPRFVTLQILKAGMFLLTCAMLLALRRPSNVVHARAVAFGLVGAMVTASASSAMLTREFVAHGLLCVMFPLFTAAFLPWGRPIQILTVLLAAFGGVIGIQGITGSLQLLIGYPSIFAFFTWIASIYIAHTLERTRLTLAQQDVEQSALESRLRDQAAISAALARIGEELIATNDRSVLLRRLCELTTEVLDCDCSWTAMKSADGGSFVIAARHGFAEEIGASLDLLVVPAEVVRAELEAADGGSPVARDSPEDAVGRLVREFGVQSWVAIPLRRGEQINGLQGAGFISRPGKFGARQERILEGIAHLASLALQSSQLVEDLEQANRIKSAFVANMSHELRTPLNVILGYNALLLEGDFGPLQEEQADALARADRNARELLDLINATLDLSRLDARRVPLNLDDLDVAAAMRELEREIKAMAANRGLQVHWAIEEGLPPIRTDLLKLRMILKNLVHNAMKFTSRGWVRVAVGAHEGGVEFVVADSGSGIAREQLGEIFLAFHQAAEARDKGGVGLGLYIVRRLLELLGGTITVDSELGKGTTVRVRLPLLPPAALPAAATSDAAGGMVGAVELPVPITAASKPTIRMVT